ncbi:MAG TPA: peroxiredoxin [Candidatus Methylomirabilis sp.]
MDPSVGKRLVGRALPPVRLPSTEGGEVDLGALRGTWVVLYTYPKNMVNMPGVTIPEGWGETPGLSGCTAEACGFRDAYADLMGRSTTVYGVSTQSTSYQQEFARRFHLPFPLLSDAELRLARALDLPTIAIAGETLLRRLTLIADPQGVVHKVYDAIPDPGGHALEVARYLDGARGRPI